MISQVSEKIKTKLKKLPNKPGVYFFIGASNKILYVGKATSLRDRVKSYFTGDISQSRGPLIVAMMPKIKDIKFEVTDSVLEALILEANLIKKHQPPHNTDEKSDRSFLYVVITDEDFPRVLTMREREVLTGKTKLPIKIKRSFGPYTSSTSLRQALKIIRKIFPYFDTKSPVEKLQKAKKVNRLSFNRQIGLYPPTDITKTEYARTIRNISLFLSGKKSQLIKKLEQEMKVLAKAKQFEAASETKKTLFALKHIQDISLIKEDFESRYRPQMRLESYDIAHLAGKDTVGVMTVVEDGEAKKTDYRQFILRGKAGQKGNDDLANLAEVLERRFKHPEWAEPNLIVIDGGKTQLNMAKKLLLKLKKNIDLVSVVKDEHHRAREILGDEQTARQYEREILLANSEAHRFAINFHKNRRLKSFRGVV